MTTPQIENDIDLVRDLCTRYRDERMSKQMLSKLVEVVLAAYNMPVRAMLLIEIERIIGAPMSSLH